MAMFSAEAGVQYFMSSGRHSVRWSFAAAADAAAATPNTSIARGRQKCPADSQHAVNIDQQAALQSQTQAWQCRICQILPPHIVRQLCSRG